MIFFQPEVIEALTSVPLQTVEEHLTDDIPIGAQDRLLRQAATIRNNFRDIFMKFADVHHAIDHSAQIDPDEIQRIGTLIVCSII